MNFLRADWSNLIMANYEISPDILLPFLPHGTELDFHEGITYVSLVGFMFDRTKIFGIPAPVIGSFEEINLRFYVLRRESGEVKRGVVFIKESVPYKAVAWLANTLYREKYNALPTKHVWQITEDSKKIEYYWKVSQDWNHIKVHSLRRQDPMPVNSLEEYIFEHYYGYTKVSEKKTEEYHISHPRWFTNPVTDFSVNCDFVTMYGKEFGFLAGTPPSSVLLAEGSAVEIEWGRASIKA